MTNTRKYLLPILVLIALAYTACTADRQPCLTPKIASLNVRSVRRASLTDTSAVDTALPAAVFLPLTGTAAPVGKYYGAPQSAFTISLASVADTCRWAMATDTAAAALHDTLTFYYKRNLQFISNACGFAYFYTIEGVQSSHQFIDSLRITNTNVTNNVNISHLQVYIHPNF